MIIVGAKGFAKEVLEVQYQLNDVGEIYFYDDVSKHSEDLLFGKYRILRCLDEVNEVIKLSSDKRFTLGVGGSYLRYKLHLKFQSAGLIFSSTISPFAHVGNYEVEICEGVNLMTGSVLTNSIHVGKGSLINLNCTVGHDTIIGEFVEISPGVHISGNCKIGSFTSIGTNAAVLPKLRIGSNSIIGAGTVVTKDVPDNVLVVGVPGKIVKRLPKQMA